VIAMSLYGSDRRYTMGAVRNAQLAPVTFPGWQLRIYMERGDKKRYRAVPESVISRLQQLGAELVDAPSDRLAPMMWRFTVINYASAAARWRGCVYVLQMFFFVFFPSATKYKTTVVGNG